MAGMDVGGEHTLHRFTIPVAPTVWNSGCIPVDLRYLVVCYLPTYLKVDSIPYLSIAKPSFAIDGGLSAISRGFTRR